MDRHLGRSFALLISAILPVMATFAQERANLSWDYDTTKDKLCSATVTTDCIKEFRLYYYDKKRKLQLASVVAASTGELKPGSTTVYTYIVPMPETPLSRKKRKLTWVVTAVTREGIESPPSNTLEVQPRPSGRPDPTAKRPRPNPPSHE